jgi:mRNA-degrading endonuclease RelE of RelBE toxin-antitoxin system
MSFSVDWDPDALVALASIWLQARNRQAVTVAQARIDELLAANPIGNGMPVSEGLFGLDEPPLRVIYEIDQEHSTVSVVSVRVLPEAD